MGKTRYLETGSVDPFYNLAFEETVLRQRREGDYLLLWQNDNTVVIGLNQNAEAEINRGFVEAHGIRVARRATGGGAVYHDLGNLNYSFITDAEGGQRLNLEKFTRPVAEALRGLGLDASVSGRNDILVGDRKVSGAAQRLMGGRMLYHGCLLFDSDPAMVAGALNADPEKFRSKSARSVRSRVGSIRPLLRETGRDMDLPAFWAYLKAALAGSAEEVRLTQAELEQAEALRAGKYATWEWNFGRSPKFDLVNKARFAGGSLEVGLQAARGRIIRVAFTGDFLGLSPLGPLTEALEGCPLRREALAAVLDRFPLAELFGGITRDEVLSVILHAGDLLGLV